MECDQSPSEECLSLECQNPTVASLDCSLDSSQLVEPTNLILPSSDQPTDIGVLDQQPTSRKPEPLKARYLRLKQKLSTVCYKHEEISFGRELTTTNKSRLMKLSIEMERQVNSQVHNQQQLQSTLRELWRVVEHRKDNDLQVLRQSKFIPSLMDFFKRVLSSHRIQYKESFRVLDAATKLLVVFCTVSANRQYLILTGRFQTIASLFSWALLKKEELGDARIITSLSMVLCYLLEHRFQGDSTRILQLSLEIVFYSQLLRRIKTTLEGSITQDGLNDEPTIKSLMRFLMCLLVQADPRSDLSEFRCEMRPVYEDPTDNAGCNLNLEWIAGAVSQLMGFILIDKETGKCEANLGASQLAILLYGVRLLNISCRLNLGLSQKNMSGDTISIVSHVVRYCKKNYENNGDTKQLLNETVVLLGYLSLDNSHLQAKVYDQGLLGELCNLPTKFIMEKTLVEILMPTLCCLVHKNQRNLHTVFNEMSSILMKKFLDGEMKTQSVMSCDGSGMHSRKLSLSSSNSAITQCSSINLSVNLGHSPHSLKMRFPRSEWANLYDELILLE